MYIEVYSGQTGQIVADKTSRSFELGRGTKPGDPRSPTLFNAVLDQLMRKLKAKWMLRKLGIKVDELLLIGSARVQVKDMLEDLAMEAQRVGLKLRMGKTKILLTRNERRGCLAQRYVEINGEKVEVLTAAEGTMYLGRIVNFSKFHDAEIEHRIRRGCAAFGKFKN